MNINDIWHFFGLDQKTIGRRRFIIAFLTAQWGVPIGILIVHGLLYLLFGEGNPLLLLPSGLAFLASIIFGFVIYIKICILRVRDIGIAQGWWWLAIVPLVNIPFLFYLVFKKGEQPIEKK